VLQGLLERFAAGDPAAKETLIVQALDRLSMIARKLLRGFGGEARVEMWTVDVFNEAYPRISKAIDEIRPVSVPQFLGLARLQMQRTLLDRVRAINGRDGKRPRTVPFSVKQPNEGAFERKASAGDDHATLVIDLVEAVGKLAETEANTVWLKLSGYTHKEIAEQLDVHKDTIDRYWNKACVKLARQLAPFIDRLSDAPPAPTPTAG